MLILKYIMKNLYRLLLAYINFFYPQKSTVFLITIFILIHNQNDGIK